MPDGTRRAGAAFPTRDLAESVRLLTAALGAGPTFVDGERWAQFDVGGSRLCLGSPAELPGGPAVMVKVQGVAEAAQKLRELGFTVGPAEAGAHEVRCRVADGGGGQVLLYEPRP